MSENRKQEQIEEIFSYYGNQKDKATQEMVVALLKELQEVEGCISVGLRKRVVEVTGITDNFLTCIIKMCPSIKESANVHEIIACTGERCGNKNGMEILRNIKKELAIGKDGMSRDGNFKLQTRNCLKQCRTAPNLMIDGKIYSGQELEDIKKLFQKI